ncbi:type VI secretion system baseplate subunit TssE [Alkalilimnicola ehrlichii MLHE-1]|uniref:IraD/Gp25-like domain-containing protein n=1 Tax=Alkalilimnicola ehrlichii (strain ATCC BAA-1101 / DSM 17681 / MLHE-1) TaxID=187272 RepID=Q0ACN3_ALKEH|nr:type VI secretion system baseplate subunit TssE [Alkalilimnicola ehrlichii]ABI55404.1 protein of unknown function DUF1316 [Alkalilimnicola ehrlichii MLHE-1]
MALSRSYPRGPRLFERLGGLPLDPGPSAADGGVLIESIKAHLADLLNSHPGHCACAPGLGLVDFNDATLGALDLRLSIRRAVRDCIERYEPRIRQVSVEVMDQGSEPAALRFKLHAVLNTDRGDQRTTLDLMLSDRHYRFID